LWRVLGKMAESTIGRGWAWMSTIHAARNVARRT
jgi:hypothetical protein